MKTPASGLTLAEIAAHLAVPVPDEGDRRVRGLATLKEASSDQVAFLANRAYLKDLADTRAAAVVLHHDHANQCPVSCLAVDNPYLAYARLSCLLDPLAKTVSTHVDCHPTAVIAEDAVLGEGVVISANAVIEAGAVIGDQVTIGAGCVIGAHSRIGDRSRLYANVTLYHGVLIGKAAILHSGCVIGGDGFGFAHDGESWHKIAQLGGVVLGDDVEVGSCTSIDRGALGDTLIGNGVKIDSQVQIAHNVQVGDHTALAGCVGIAGSSRIGRHCLLGGGVGISGHLELCDGVHVTGMSLVTNSISEPGIYSSGTGAMNNAQWRRNAVRFKQLDEIARRLQRLEKHQADTSGS